MRRLVAASSSTPIVALGTLTVLLAAALILILSGKADKGSGLTLLAVLVGSLPGVVAAIYSERTARDVRNGVVIDKSRQGAVAALADTGVVKETNEAVQSARAEIERVKGHGNRQEDCEESHEESGGEESGGGDADTGRRGRGRHRAPWQGH